MAEDRRGAFALDAAIHTATAAAKAAWWTTAGRAARAMVRPTKGEQATEFQPTTPPVSAKRLRAAYFAAFEKDARDVAAGLYPAMDTDVDPAEPPTCSPTQRLSTSAVAGPRALRSGMQ